MAEKLCMCTMSGSWIDNLSFASREGHTDCVEKFISEIGGKDTFTPIQEEVGKDTPLIFASSKGHSQIAEILLRAGAYVNCTGNDDMTPLTAASHRGHTEAVRLLLAWGADTTKKTKSEKRTALALAAAENHTEIIMLLLSAGADIECKDIFSETPLSIAAENGNLKAVEVLYRAGGNVNATPFLWAPAIRHTPMTAAIERGNVETIKLLLTLGVDVNQKIPQAYLTYTTLHFAAMHYSSATSYALLKLLLHWNADVRIKEKGTESIIDWICCTGWKLGAHASNIPLLYVAGATMNTDLLDKHGVTIPQIILDDQAPMLTLADLCRRQIRGWLLSPTCGNQSNLVVGVPKLELPRRLADFLLFYMDISEGSEFQSEN